MVRPEAANELKKVNELLLVNGRCPILRGQCRRRNGGLWYENYEEFEACLNFILTNEGLSTRMDLQGKMYTEKNYHWDMIKSKHIKLVQGLLSSRPS